MDSKDELKDIDTKNCTWYYLDGMKVIDIDFSDISLNKKSYENILIYDILHKTLMGVKPLCIWFKK